MKRERSSSGRDLEQDLVSLTVKEARQIGARCGEDSFTCVTSQSCVPLMARCDGYNTCADGSDELNCSQYTCLGDVFKCSHGQFCTPFRCDGDDDCGDGSDELNCGPLVCPVGHVPCASKHKCVLGQYRCDGDNDCGDLSDEMNCELTPGAVQRF